MTFAYKPYEGNEPYVFISYCREDTALCNQIIKFLAENGIRVWYDNAIHVGDMWPDVIANHLKKSSACILIMTDGFVRSINCNKELVFSYKHKIPTVPILLDGTNISPGMDLMISAAQYIKISRDGPLRVEKLLESKDILACQGEKIVKKDPENDPKKDPEKDPENDPKKDPEETKADLSQTEQAAQKPNCAIVVVDADAGKACAMRGKKAWIKVANGALQVAGTASDAIEILCEGEECLISNGSGQTICFDNGMVKPGERAKISGETWMQIEDKSVSVLCGETAKTALCSKTVGVLSCPLSREKKCAYSSVLVLGTDHIWPKGTLNDPYIARENALVIRRDDEFILKDAAMDSLAHGTIVNRVFLEAGQEHVLKTGDTIQIGETVLVFKQISLAE